MGREVGREATTDVVVDDERLTKALAEVGLLVDVDLGGDDVPERHEHLHQFLVPELLRQVVDEQVRTLGTCERGEI